MEMIFLNTAGTVLFVRDDMEQGNWTQEEYTVNATFPYIDGKVIQRGQRIAFRDPATNNIEVFEIRNVTNIEPEHYQQFIAENIAVSELSDEHLNTTEITDKTAAQALTTILSGTLWSLGNNTASGTSSVDIVRGSVWNGVSSIIQNWNVYITPRITFNSAGSITGRYLDISPAQGTWRGVRLSIEKNMLDSSVIYDDTDVITAMYGYGGNIDVEQQTTLDTTEELTFKDVVWTQTADHPAKPANQTYLEYPEKTALYGRNGRPRYGYYQNSDIKDANVLLQKTWETLKQTCDPKISISGMVADLYRLGYADQPLRLHDTVIIEIKETGEKFEKTIIKLDVDLIDPTSTRPEIGDYIPNIIYINRDSEEKASGGGGGGGRGQTNEEKKEYDTFYDLSANTDELGSWISMVVGKRNGSTYIKAGEITLSINSSSGESTALINADHVNISATSTVHTLAGDLTHDAQGRLVIKNAGGMYVERNEQGTTSYFGVWDKGNLTGGVMVTQINGQTGTVTRILGDKIVVGNGTGIDPTYRGKTLDGTLTEITTDFTSVNTLLANKIEASDINATTVQAAISNMTILRCNSMGCSGGAAISGLLNAAGNITTPYIELDGVSVGAAVYNVQIVSDGGNGYKLQKQTITGSGWVDCGSFSRAITSANWGWSGSAPKVTLSPQNQSFTSTLLVDNYSLTGSPTYNSSTGRISQHADIVDSTGDTITTFTISIDATAAYNAGWNACRQYAIDYNGQTVLTGYSTYNSGRSTSLYTEPSSSASIASGAARVWRYGGSTATRYTLPAAK